jgi:hypothetical protein
MNAAISREDQCDNPVSAGGLCRVAARIARCVAAAAIAVDLLAWLQTLALDGDLADVEPNGCAIAC